MMAFISSQRWCTAATMAARGAAAVTAAKRQGGGLVADGGQIAASNSRSSAARGTGRSAKARTLRREDRSSRRSVKLEASVDVPDLTGDVARLVGGEEADD